MAIKNLGRVQGLSAYEIWLQQGNTGTEEDFIASLIGESGRGIASIEKTSTSGLIDTYTITYTDDTTDTFQVKNGKDGTNGIDGKDGANGQDGQDGRGIVKIEKTSTAGLVDTYTITYTDNTTSTFQVTNGKDGSESGGSGTNVEANPILEGNEDFLKSIEIGNTKYSTKPDLSGKVISIMGDSISTYAGWIPNSEGKDDGTGTLMHAIFYPNYGSYVNNVSMTWWHKLIFDKFKAKLGVNESWSGSFVGNNKDTNSATPTSCHAPGNDTGPDTCMAGMTRIKRLSANGTPDIIYVYGGTNDIAQPGTPGESLGNFDSSVDYSSVDTTSTKWSTFVDAYRTMLQRMQYLYPKSKIIALLPTYCVNYYNRTNLDAWVEQIKNICDYFGVNYIDLRACGITWSNSSSSRNAKGIQTLGDSNIHPNDLGHTMIADYVEAETYKILNNDFKENVVYSVTNNLTSLVNTKSYIAGVTEGENYEAVITGSDLTKIIVTMNGVDITSTVYTSSTGKIAIANVAGNIVISEGQGVIKPVTGVKLNASSKSVMIGDVEKLTATIIPEDATNKNVTWSVNNSNVTIAPNGLTCTVTGALNGESVVTVTTEDGDFTANCTFTIHEVQLTGISITTPPTKTAYHYGEVFNPSGVKITASYDDGTTEILDDSDYTYSPTTALTENMNITFSYTYNGVTKTATQAVTVATLESIEITTQPTKTNYSVGQLFDTTGMIVTANWSDNTTSTVTDYTYSPNGALTISDTTIIISYTAGEITKTTTQSIIVSAEIESITINGEDSVNVGSFITLTNSVTPAGVDATKVIWSITEGSGEFTAKAGTVSMGSANALNTYVFWITNLDDMVAMRGKVIKSITMNISNTSQIQVYGSSTILDKTATGNQLGIDARTADSNKELLFTITPDTTGIVTFLLDGTDSRVNLYGKTEIICPNSIGFNGNSYKWSGANKENTNGIIAFCSTLGAQGNVTNQTLSIEFAYENNILSISQSGSSCTVTGLAEGIGKIKCESATNSSIYAEKQITVTTTEQPTQYNYMVSVQNGTNLSGTINENESVTLNLIANTGYELPDTITVNEIEGTSGSTGVNWTYNKSSGALSLNNPTTDVVVAIECVKTGITWYSSNYNANILSSTANLNYAGFAYMSGVNDGDGLQMNMVRFVLDTPGKITVGKCSSDFKTIVDSEQITVNGSSGDVIEQQLSKTYTLENGEHFFINAPSGDTGMFKYTNRSVPATEGDRGFKTKVGTAYVGTNATDVTTQQKECLSVDFGYKG